MNIFAHLFLSGDNEEVIIGNFIGDFVKGLQVNNYPTEIQKGIFLHRKIDYFTDNHPIVLESKIRLRPKFRHYAPVIVDVFYDHFLTKNWTSFSPIPLLDYTKKSHKIIKKYLDILPEKALYLFEYMVKNDVLYNYQFIEGIDRTLTGMSKRTKFESKMEEATITLEKDYNCYEKEFFAFFPELNRYAVSIIENQN